MDLRRLRKKKTDDEKKEKKKQNETKRERNLQENWADEFPGVRHAVPLDKEGNIDESTPKVMFCQTCRDYPDLVDKNSSMYLGQGLKYFLGSPKPRAF